MRIYQLLSTRQGARLNCIKNNNEYWLDKHTEAIEEAIRKYLPSGSGIDSGVQFDYKKSSSEKLVLNSSYHVMNENGYYTGWIDFKVIVTPSLQFDYIVKITGMSRAPHIREYLEMLFSEALGAYEPVKKEE